MSKMKLDWDKFDKIIEEIRILNRDWCIPYQKLKTVTIEPDNDFDWLHYISCEGKCVCTLIIKGNEYAVNTKCNTIGLPGVYLECNNLEKAMNGICEFVHQEYPASEFSLLFQLALY